MGKVYPKIATDLRNGCAEKALKNSPYLNSPTKRLFDLFICLAALPLCLAVMLAVAAIIFLIDGKDVFFIQKRATCSGKPFKIIKFRTLKPDSKQKTRTGEILRKYHIDELPQIISIIAGKMSLVGPRPEIYHITQDYTEKQKRRLIAAPGLTGLWQIFAARDKPIHQNMKYDLYYIKKASLLLDIKMLFLTAAFVLYKIPAKKDYEDSIYNYNLSMPK